MKKLVRIASLAAAVAVLPSLASAQDNQFNKDTKILHVGLLVAGESYGGMGIGAGFEAGVAEIASGMVRLGVGADVGFLRHSYGSYLSSAYGYKITVLPVTVFVNGHYQIKQVPKLDVYAGPVVGVAHSSYSFDGDDVFYRTYFKSTSNDVIVGVHAGARYELTSAVAGSLQVSGGSSQLPWVNVGVAFKF